MIHDRFFTTPWRNLSRIAIVAGALFLTAASTPRYDWSTVDPSYFGGLASMPEAAATRAVCARLLHLTPPADRAAPPTGCHSEALLYGIGRPADPVAARRCAWHEYDHPPRDGDLAYFQGPGILAVAYANGWGGPRDMDMAIHMACGIEDAPAATQARIEHLQALAKQGPGAKPFGICDDITSGLSGGVCAAHHAALEDQRRDRILARWQRDWPPARRVAFDRLKSSLIAYAQAAHAMDCYGGTAATQCTIEGVEADLARFTAKVGALLGHNPPPAGPSQRRRSNAATDAAEWGKFLATLDDSEQRLYAEQGRMTVAARSRFERDLLAFAATVPGATPHGVRVLFSDL